MHAGCSPRSPLSIDILIIKIGQVLSPQMSVLVNFLKFLQFLFKCYNLPCMLMSSFLGLATCCTCSPYTIHALKSTLNPFQLSESMVWRYGHKADFRLYGFQALWTSCSSIHMTILGCIPDGIDVILPNLLLTMHVYTSNIRKDTKYAMKNNTEKLLQRAHKRSKSYMKCKWLATK